MAASESEPVRLEVQASVQATEDLEKVQRAIHNLFPQDIQTALTFKTSTVRGHYHNPIILIETQVTQSALIEQILTSLGQKLTSADRDQIARTFASRINSKGQLFLRFDKQEAYLGKLRIVNRGDSIRFVIRFSGRKPTQSELENHSRRFHLI